MNDDILIELGKVTEETHGLAGPLSEDDVPETFPIT